MNTPIASAKAFPRFEEFFSGCVQHGADDADRAEALRLWTENNLEAAADFIRAAANEIREQSPHVSAASEILEIIIRGNPALRFRYELYAEKQLKENGVKLPAYPPVFPIGANDARPWLLKCWEQGQKSIPEENHLPCPWL